MKARAEVTGLVQKGVSLFELDRETMLLTDWSKTGVGYLLQHQQKHCQCPMDNAPHCGVGHWRTILVGSRFLKDAETRYAPVEGEALALVFGLESTRDYCMGNPKLTIGVDHKPLVSIMGDKLLDPRLRNLKDKTLMYKFAIKHIPGTLHKGPDAASRYPGTTATRSTSVINVAREIQPADLDTKDTWSVSMASSLEDFKAVTWDRLVEKSVCDETCAAAIRYLEHGFPEDKNGLPEHLRPLWHYREELYAIDNVLCYNNRLYIPLSLSLRIAPHCSPRSSKHEVFGKREILLAGYGRQHNGEAQQVRCLQPNVAVATQRRTTGR